jgi:hypothetical protein
MLAIGNHDRRIATGGGGFGATISGGASGAPPTGSVCGAGLYATAGRASGGRGGIGGDW